MKITDISGSYFQIPYSNSVNLKNDQLDKNYWKSISDISATYFYLYDTNTDSNFDFDTSSGTDTDTNTDTDTDTETDTDWYYFQLLRLGSLVILELGSQSIQATFYLT